MQNNNDFFKRLWQLSVPIVLQELMLALVAAADAFMLGRLDQNSMSAVSLATQIQFVQNILLMAMISTISILGAQYWGKKDIRTLNDVFMRGLKFSAGISILFFLGCLLFPTQLMLIFTNEPELVRLGVSYLRIAGWSYLMTGISQCYLMLMKVTGHTGEPARISSCTVLLNILLNAALIFGLLGFPQLGVRGAAIATLIARSIELVWSILACKQKQFVDPDFGRLFASNKPITQDFIRCMLPLLGASALWGIGFTSYSAFMGHLGTDAAAANSVTAVIRDILCCMANGLASGGGILVGNELGAGQLEKGRSYGIRTMKISYIIGLSCTAVMLALTPLVSNFVSLTPLAQRYLKGMMVIMAFYMIGRTVNTVTINGIFAAGGDVLFDVYSLAVTMWMLAVPLAALGTFVFHWNPLIVYTCTCLDEVGKIPWVMYHFRKYRWVRDLTR